MKDDHFVFERVTTENYDYYRYETSTMKMCMGVLAGQEFIKKFKECLKDEEFLKKALNDGKGSEPLS